MLRGWATIFLFHGVDVMCRRRMVRVMLQARLTTTVLVSILSFGVVGIRFADKNTNAADGQKQEPTNASTQKNKTGWQFTVSKETTYITGPMNNVGSIDY